MSKITKVTVILKPSDFDDLNSLIGNLVRWFKRREIEIYFSKNEKERLQGAIKSTSFDEIIFAEDSTIYNEVDLLISLGGDGTLLGVSRNIASHIPVYGVNLGRLGFLTEFSKKEFYEKLNSILFGKYDFTTKSLFEITIKRAGKITEKNYFFNDIVFSKNDIARMFTLSLEGEGEHIFNLTGDGLIISSTYGSTAYSLAAGGPIVHPDVAALILTPICAHSLTHRPMVIPDTYKLKVGLIDKINTAHITLDGQVAIQLEANDFISIKKSVKKCIKLIMNPERTYFHTLKEKFVHGRRNL